MGVQEWKPVKEGKVREVYDNGDNLIIVATDRISAFDVILKNQITQKGAILTQMSKFWFDFTKDIVPNHMVSTETADMPEFFQKEEFEGRSMKCRKLEMLPVECIVRGYITGSGWESYQKDGTVCGIRLPEGLQESDKLPEPIYTPTTKAELGLHDAPVTFEGSVEILENSIRARAKITPLRYGTAPSAFMRNARNTLCAKASSSPTRSLSSAWTRTARSFWGTRCSRRTAPGSGRLTVMRRGSRSRPLTSSS